MSWLIFVGIKGETENVFLSNTIKDRQLYKTTDKSRPLQLSGKLQNQREANVSTVSLTRFYLTGGLRQNKDPEENTWGRGGAVTRTLREYCILHANHHI